MQQGSIGRRLEAAFAAFNQKDYETCLIHLFPAMDKTAKKRRPKSGVGERIRKFIEQDEDLLSYIATGGSIITNLHISEMTIPEAIYLYARCPIAHEGELDPRLKITEENALMFGDEWVFSAGYIFSLMVSILVAQENSNEFLTRDLTLIFNNTEFSANQIWGKSVDVRKAIGLTARMNR